MKDSLSLCLSLGLTQWLPVHIVYILFIVDILQKLDCNVQVICFICNDCGYVTNNTLFPIVMQYIGPMGALVKEADYM